MDKPHKACTNANHPETTSLQGRCRISNPVRKCMRKESQDSRPEGRTISSEDDIRSRLGAYGLEIFYKKATVNVPRKQKVFKGLTPLEFDKSELLKEEQTRIGVKRRQVKNNKLDPDHSSLDKLSLTLSAPVQETTVPRECSAPKREFPEQTFTLENAPTCRAFCISEGLQEPRVRGRKKFPQRK
ncbi:unnamed protein product [Ixodes hexagonus]